MTRSAASRLSAPLARGRNFQVPSREATKDELTVIHTAEHVDAMNLVASMPERMRMVAAHQYVATGSSPPGAVATSSKFSRVTKERPPYRMRWSRGPQV